MMLFIGWSGEPSRDIAQQFRDWIEKVHPGIFPFVSFEDIRPGMDWRKTLSQSLMKANFGVTCMTQANLNAPWLLYETGLLSMATSVNNPDGEPRIAPVLFGVVHTDKLPDAIRPYQSVNYDDGRAMWNLIRSMNELCVKLYGAELQRLGAATPLTYLKESALKELFQRHYPAFVGQARRILESGEPRADASRVDDDADAPMGGASPAEEDAVSRNANRDAQNAISTFSDKLEDFYQAFGAYPDTARVYFEGRQLAELFRDGKADDKDKKEDLRRFHMILKECEAYLKRTESAPQRRVRIRAIKELKEPLQNF